MASRYEILQELFALNPGRTLQEPNGYWGDKPVYFGAITPLGEDKLWDPYGIMDTRPDAPEKWTLSATPSGPPFTPPPYVPRMTPGERLAYDLARGVTPGGEQVKVGNEFWTVGYVGGVAAPGKPGYVGPAITSAAQSAAATGGGRVVSQDEGIAEIKRQYREYLLREPGTAEAMSWLSLGMNNPALLRKQLLGSEERASLVKAGKVAYVDPNSPLSGAPIAAVAVQSATGSSVPSPQAVQQSIQQLPAANPLAAATAAMSHISGIVKVVAIGAGLYYGAKYLKVIR